MESMIEDEDLQTKIVFDVALYKKKHGRFGSVVAIKSTDMIDPGLNFMLCEMQIKCRLIFFEGLKKCGYFFSDTVGYYWGFNTQSEESRHENT